MKPTYNEATQSEREPACVNKEQTAHTHEPCILKTWLARRQWLLKPILHR